MSFDAPQADRLDLVRRVVEAVRGGRVGADAIAGQARIAPRYALYALQSARLLEFIEEDPEGTPKLTPTGVALLSTVRGSPTERDCFRDALRTSKTLGWLHEPLLGEARASRDLLAEMLLARSNASLSTALRRASTLVAWRRYLIPREEDSQLQLVALEWNGDLDAPRPPESPDTGAIASVAPAHVDPVRPDDTTGIERPVDISLTASGEYLVEQQDAHSATPLPDSVRPPPADDLPEPVVVGESVAAVLAEPSPASQGRALLDEYDLAYIRRQVQEGALILFTGAGFSMSARDVKGRTLPSGAALAQELFALCHGPEPYDGSSLQDTFEYAQRRHGKALNEHLQTRLAVDGASLPGWYERWFALPWAKIYTLNVDDLATAADRRFDLPRGLRPVSALREAPRAGSANLDVIHLNGLATDGAEAVTFSTEQYAQRLARQEPHYAQLAADMLTRPIVFVGSPLDEPLLWQHIALRQLRAAGSHNELRPRSFLVTPFLNVARRDRLRDHHVVWIKATAEEFASYVLSRLEADAVRGHKRLSAGQAADTGDERNIVEVASVVGMGGRRTEFLLGEEPSWNDIENGRAIERDEDLGRLDKLCESALEDRPTNQRVRVVAIQATAGAGKTTLLMKIALHIHAAGVRVAWVGAGSEVAPRALSRFYRGPDRPPVLVLDDAGRYGPHLVPTISQIAAVDAARLVVLSLQSHQERLLDAPAAASLAIERIRIGPLQDGDIDRLLAALEREKRLGELRALTHAQRVQAFRDRADRQILVAMIEATSGVRFEERVVQEWQGLDATSQYIYALVALATANGYALTHGEIVLACSGGPRELEAIRALHRSHLLIEDDHRVRVRHRVIAETLLQELTARGSQLERLVIGLCRALAIEGALVERRSSRRKRTLKRLLNHDALLRLLTDVELARNVYAALERDLDGDYHFWLQRGCLELEEGDVRLAENFLGQSAAINANDPLVENAVAHMQLRKAILNPAALGAEELAARGFEKLRELVAARGTIDSYPAHVFGSQALAWCHRAALTVKVRAALLREAKEILERAVVIHRSRQELRQLLADITKEGLRPR